MNTIVDQGKGRVTVRLYLFDSTGVKIEYLEDVAIGDGWRHEESWRLWKKQEISASSPHCVVCRWRVVPSLWVVADNADGSRSIK